MEEGDQSLAEPSANAGSSQQISSRPPQLHFNMKRVPPMWPLSKDETISSFEAWKGNFLYTLNLDDNFASFLNGQTWDKKTKGGRPFRGLQNAQQENFLNLLLGQIANFVPVISRNTILKNSTSIESIWHLIKCHYGFQSSGSSFLNLCDIKLEPGERFEDLFQRIQTFFENNLLSADCGILHHGETLNEDEDLSPSLENVIVYLWLQLINKDLPGLIKIKYGPELRHKSLASIKPEISCALNSLLEELGASNPSILRTSASNFNNRRPNRFVGNYSSRSGQGSGFRSDPNQSRQPPSNRSPVCSICKNSGRPHNHFLSSCSSLTPDDKRWLSRARLISAIDDEMSHLDVHAEAYDDPECERNFDSHISQSPAYHHVEQPFTNSQVYNSCPPSAKRVTTSPSPYLNVFVNQSIVKFTLDTGATVNMIHESVAKQLGLHISPSSQIATQADGKSEIDILGEVRFNVTRDNIPLYFEGLVARKMDTDVLAGIPFIAKNNISIHPARNVVMINDSSYPYGSSSARAHVARVQTSLARHNTVRETVWPGEYFEASCDIDPCEDTEVAVEPHCSTSLSIPPVMTTCLKGRIRLTNTSNRPIVVGKDAHVAQVTRSIECDDLPSSYSMPDESASSFTLSKRNASLISINPSKLSEVASWTQKYDSLHHDFEHVFSDQFPGYNGHSGNIEASVNITNCLPPQRKGRIPLYNRDRLVELQNQFDSLESIGVFAKPEDVGVHVEYVNPSFLVKKSDGGFRLVTSFGEVAKHCKPSPSLMPNVESTLRQIGQWRYIIKSDLAKAYFQIPLCSNSQKYCGVVTPFRGMRVYQRSAMGMPGSESVLEELMSRILGDLILKGRVIKLADDLYCGSDSLDELYKTWAEVLQLLSVNDLRLSATKTVILPASTSVLGWIWSQGTLTASDHQVSPLIKADPPKTVRELRSFIGAFKALSKVIEGCSRTISPLDSLTAGRSSTDKISWTESSISCFNAAKDSLKHTKCITIPKRSDQLWIVTDASISACGIGATMYLTRPNINRPLLAGFFSAKLKQHQPRWLPCELEALAVTSACNHFRPFIIHSSKQTRVLTDSRPCVQAYGKLLRGEFSASARVQTFLTMVSNLNVSLQHVSGASNIVADYASRNVNDCPESNCQICKFNSSLEEAVVFAIREVEPMASLPVPFPNRSSWRSLQRDCPSISQTITHLMEGTRPSKKSTKINDTKRYLQVSTLSRDGLLIVRNQGPFSPSVDRIVVPRSMVTGILTSIHIKSNHPTAHQLKLVFNRNFMCLDVDKQAKEITNSCLTCASVMHLSKHVTEFSTSETNNHIGFVFSVDVLRRARQYILVCRESVTSYTTATFIGSEKAEDLLEGVINSISPLHPPDGPPSKIRSDSAPGFKSLLGTQPLRDKGLLFELGRTKNPNKNPIVDKAIRELEDEIIRLEPSGCPISTKTLTFALVSLNARIRRQGLSSFELMFRRNQFTAEELNTSDRDVISAQLLSRKENHSSSLKSQLPRSAKPSPTVIPPIGSIVFLKNELSKHKARYTYSVTSIDGDWLFIQRLKDERLFGKPYKVHVSECFSTNTCPTPSLPDRAPSVFDDIDDVVLTHDPHPSTPELTIDGSSRRPVVSDQNVSCQNGANDGSSNAFENVSPAPQVTLRRSTRLRRPPPYLEDYTRRCLSSEIKEEEITPWRC